MDIHDKIITYESGGLDELDTILLFSELVKNGYAWSLQGHYGRTAHSLIEAGILDEKGNITIDISKEESFEF